MRIWLTGATGFVGSAVLAALVSRGDEVIVLTRPASRPRLGDLPPSVEVIPTSLPVIGDTLDRLERPDAIVHLAALLGRGRTISIADCRAVHVEATRQLAEQARRHAARLVYLSSISVVGCRDQDFIANERTPCKPTDDYGATKLEGERAIEQAEVDHVIMRPPGIWGAGSVGDPLLGIARRVSARLPVARGRRVSLLHVDNAVAAILGVGLERRTSGQTYFIDDGQVMTHEDIARVLGELIEIEPIVVEQSALRTLRKNSALKGLAFARALSRRIAMLAAALPEPTVYPTLDTTRIASAGYAPVTTLRAGCRSLVDWARKSGALRSPPEPRTAR